MNALQASHFTANGGTKDFAYGQRAANQLAQSNPDKAVFNADNHEYFAVAAFGDGEGETSVLLTQVHFGKHILDL